jgi:predicted O-methyltransferase YrrM
LSNPWKWVRIALEAPLVCTSVTTEEIESLGHLAAGRDCLEIGSAFGYSAIMMARYGAQSVTAIDPHLPCNSNNMAGDSYDVMLANIDAGAASGIVTVIRQRSQDALPVLAARGERFGLVFIDADHSYESVMHDVGWARRLVTDDGFIACHDYGHWVLNAVKFGIESVNRALDEIFPGGPDWLDGTLHVTKARPIEEQ